MIQKICFGYPQLMLLVEKKEQGQSSGTHSGADQFAGVDKPLSEI